jgi:hypothetical protein
MNRTLLLTIIAIFSLALIIQTPTVSALTRMALSGDFGGKSASVANLENIDKANTCFLGLGDYMYNEHPGSNVGGQNGGGDVKLGQLWDNIRCKVGFPGNHELGKNQEADWAAETFRYSDQGFGAWRLKDVGIIGINPYEDFEKGSDQYNFVDRKAKEFDARPGINWIVFAVHEPFWTPTTIGGHGPNTDLRDTYEPIIKRTDGAILAQAHNHIIALGTVSDINQMICGGGGYGGDELGKLNGWEWGTDEMGWCFAEFEPNAVTVKSIGTDGELIRSQTFTR